jgi:hypothetical protein
MHTDMEDVPQGLKPASLLPWTVPFGALRLLRAG